MSTAKPPTIGDALELPPMIDLVTAARYLGIGRTTVYALAANDALPVPVVRIGTALRVPTAPLLKLLGIAPPEPTGTGADPAHHGPDVPADHVAFEAAERRGHEDPPRPPLRRTGPWSVDRPRAI